MSCLFSFSQRIQQTTPLLASRVGFNASRMLSRITNPKTVISTCKPNCDVPMPTQREKRKLDTLKQPFQKADDSIHEPTRKSPPVDIIDVDALRSPLKPHPTAASITKIDVPCVTAPRSTSTSTLECPGFAPSAERSSSAPLSRHVTFSAELRIHDIPCRTDEEVQAGESSYNRVVSTVLRYVGMVKTLVEVPEAESDLFSPGFQSV
jgi:hypothetical protein